MFKKLKSLLVGRTLKSTDAENEKFKVLWGLPILSSDAISSVSYACEEILMVLAPALGMAAYKPLLGAAAAINRFAVHTCVLLPPDDRQLPQRRRLL